LKLLRRVTLLLGAVMLATACGAAAATSGNTSGPTLPIGALPEQVVTSSSPASGSAAHRTTTTLSPEDQIGAIAKGNRVIVIGDSVMASTSKRYTNDMCNALVPLGWQVELDAESGRFVDFGLKVLGQRLSAGWDASVILLGNNYLGNQDEYRTSLEKMVTELSPQPVVLLTVSEFIPSRAEVNQVIFEMAQKYPNVLIVDWAATTAADNSLTGGDNLHLTNYGRQVLAENVALALGQAPEQPGKCLDTTFTDDSSGPVQGTTTTTIRRHTSTTTTAHTTATTTEQTTPTPAT
jgi:hypothetical protein